LSCLAVPYSHSTEGIVGGLKVFLPYAKNYVDTFMGKSITTQEWKDHLYAYFQAQSGTEALDKVDWDVSVLNLHNDIIWLHVKFFLGLALWY
jgi:hypothetical protein